MEEDRIVILQVPRSVNKRPWRIISGGQTGVDRAGLVAAMTYGIRVGGWLPKGRLAEDGVVPDGFYGMKECDGGYRERTRLNVLHADATLVISDKFPISGGTDYTIKVAAELGKPCKIVDLDAPGADAQIREWMLSLESTIPDEKERIILNVAGPRESISPGIFEKAEGVLCSVFVRFRNWSGGDVCQIDEKGNLLGWIEAECIETVDESDKEESSAGVSS